MTDVLRELVLPRLEAVRKSGGGFMARCPTHEDRQASLAVGPGKDQPVVFHCHAGCAPDDIVARLGLTWEQLSTPRDRAVDDATWTPAGPAVAVYDYVDEQGKLLFQVCRTASKDFRQRVPDTTAKSGWTWKLGDTRRVLYRLPDVVAAVRDQREVWICEGEKDVATLTAHGLVATCNPGGAGKWRPEYTEVLRDAVVPIVADADEPGRAHARHIADALTEVGAEVRILEAASGKDVTDHIRAGHNLVDLVQTWPAPDEPPATTPVDRLRSLLLDTAGLDNLPNPEPLIRGVLQRNSLAWLIGRPGSAKTFIALDMAAAIGTGQTWQGFPTSRGLVLYLIAEGATGIRQRVRAWEAAAGTRMTGVRFLPVAVQAAHDAQWSAFCQLATELRPHLIVLDTQARITVGMEENSAQDMGVFVDRAEQLRTASDACVLVLHHTPRVGDHMRGSTAMEGAATTIIRVVKDGDFLTVTNDPEDGGKQKDTEPFAPINLRLTPYESSVIVTATEPGSQVRIDTRAVQDMLKSWWQLHGSDPVSVAVLVKSGVCSDRTFHRNRGALLRAAIIGEEGKGNTKRYHLVNQP